MNPAFLEWSAVAFSILGVWLMAQRRMLAWPVGLVSVGLYALLRIGTQWFGNEAGALAGYGADWLLWAGLATLLLGALGALAATRLRMQVAYLVVVSACRLVSKSPTSVDPAASNSTTSIDAKTDPSSRPSHNSPKYPSSYKPTPSTNLHHCYSSAPSTLPSRRKLSSSPRGRRTVGCELDAADRPRRHKTRVGRGRRRSTKQETNLL